MLRDWHFLFDYFGCVRECVWIERSPRTSGECAIKAVEQYDSRETKKECRSIYKYTYWLSANKTHGNNIVPNIGVENYSTAAAAATTIKQAAVENECIEREHIVSFELNICIRNSRISRMSLMVFQSISWMSTCAAVVQLSPIYAQQIKHFKMFPMALKRTSSKHS